MFSYLIVEHAKGPYLSSLQPNELVSIIHFSLSVKTSKKPTVFLVEREVFPKRNDLLFQLLTVKSSIVIKFHLLRIII